MQFINMTSRDVTVFFEDGGKRDFPISGKEASISQQDVLAGTGGMAVSQCSKTESPCPALAPFYGGRNAQLVQWL